MSLRYLRAHRIVYFSIAGVAIGIMAMVVVSSVMNGFKRDIQSRIRGVQSDIVVSSPYQLFIPDYPAVMADLNKIEGVAGSAPRLKWSVMVYTGTAGSRRLYTLIGINPESEQAMGELMPYFRAGGLPSEIFRPAVPERGIPAILGAESHGYFDFKVLTFRPSGGSFERFESTFTYRGTFKTGLTEYDTLYLYSPLSEVQKFLRLDAASLKKDVVNEIAVRVRPGADPNAVKERISDYLKGRFGKRYSAVTWKEAKASFLTAVDVERNVQTIIMFLTVVVAAFNIVAIFSLMVRAKVKDIGILQAVGSSRAGIRSIFLRAGVMCGTLGAVIGVTVGLLLASFLNQILDVLGIEIFPRDVYYLEAIPVEIDYLSVVLIVVFSMAVSFLFSVYPARQAARLDPVEAIRYE